jgi:RNase P subunit RPR2
MIDLGNIAGLYEHDHQLHAYCPSCDRWRVLNLEWLVRQKKGEIRLPIRVRCRDCGEIGQLQVRPPRPKWNNANGWI